MIIRKATISDVKQCETISRITEFQMTDGEFPDFKTFEQSLNHIFLVAEEKDKIVGLILGYYLTKELVYLDLFTVIQAYRDKNIGTKLLNTFRIELKKLSIKNYFLIAPSLNKKTLRFYRKNGLAEGKQYTLFSQMID
jgi:N-acetylglutamate synthase-like GNAT family acetyltransferase